MLIICRHLLKISNFKMFTLFTFLNINSCIYFKDVCKLLIGKAKNITIIFYVIDFT